MATRNGCSLPAKLNMLQVIAFFPHSCYVPSTSTFWENDQHSFIHLRHPSLAFSFQNKVLLVPQNSAFFISRRPHAPPPLALPYRVDCQRKRIPPTKVNIFAQYVTRVRSCIHLVICMSPIGSAFRDRLRMFPSLVNCCTIGEKKRSKMLVFDVVS